MKEIKYTILYCVNFYSIYYGSGSAMAKSSATLLVTYRLDEGGSYEGAGWPARQPAGQAGAAGSWTSAPIPRANKKNTQWYQECLLFRSTVLYNLVSFFFIDETR